MYARLCGALFEEHGACGGLTESGPLNVKNATELEVLVLVHRCVGCGCVYVRLRLRVLVRVRVDEKTGFGREHVHVDTCARVQE